MLATRSSGHDGIEPTKHFLKKYLARARLAEFASWELKRRFALAANVLDEETAELKQQAAQIQKVSAQLEASKFATGRIRRGGPAPQVVNNP
jgi:hypothetical protein